jgi:hypothetical protein
MSIKRHVSSLDRWTAQGVEPDLATVRGHSQRVKHIGMQPRALSALEPSHLVAEPTRRATRRRETFRERALWTTA